VNEACTEVREILESGERPGDAQVVAHLDGCPACRAHAALLAALAQVEPGEADEMTVRRVMAALPPAGWQRRRLAAWLPLAAGLALVAGGWLLVGGVPAAGTVAQLPAAAQGVLAWIGASVADALTAARGGSDAAKVVAAAGGIWFVVWLALAALGGGWAMVALAARGRRGAGR